MPCVQSQDRGMRFRNRSCRTVSRNSRNGDCKLLRRDTRIRTAETLPETEDPGLPFSEKRLYLQAERLTELLNYRGMVESQGGKRIQGEPSRAAGIVLALDFGQFFRFQ